MAPMTDPATALPSAVGAVNSTILIVDDSRLMRHALKKILKDDFNLVEAVDGEDAWEKLQEVPSIQAIFSDLSMPNLDGYGLLERVRNSGETRICALPFIVITGKEGDVSSLREEAQMRGANEILCKPFKSDEIVGMTKTFLSPAGQNDTGAATQLQAELAAEQEAQRVADEAAAQQQAEETARLAAEQEAQRVAEEAAAQQQAEETARLAAEQEAQRVADEVAQQPAEDTFEVEALEAVQLTVEETAEHSANDDESQPSDGAVKTSLSAAANAQRFPPLVRLCVRLALPFMHIGNRLLGLNKDKQLSALRKRL